MEVFCPTNTMKSAGCQQNNKNQPQYIPKEVNCIGFDSMLFT
jgi:hypothetical protein